MSRYEWPQGLPAGSGDADEKDDATGRARHNARRRTGLAIADLLKEAAAPQRRPGVARAPANSDAHLWQPLGPATMLNGQAEGSPRVSGRVNALCVHRDGRRAYAASANGGVWATTDGGARWQSVGGLGSTNTAGIVQPAQRNACAALHVLWDEPAIGNETVFMGTGEPRVSYTGRTESGEAGVGIFVATAPLGSAAADPWTREAANLVNNGVYAFASDPGDTTGARIVAATQTGLYERPTTPFPPAADAHWPRASGTPFNSGSQVCTSVLWTAGDPVPAVSPPPADQLRPARLWVWVHGGLSAGLWVRDAGSTHFRAVLVDATNSAFAWPDGRGVLAAAMTNPVTTPAHVWLLSDGGSFAALFRVTNPRPADGPPVALAVSRVPDILHDSGWYNLALAVDPSQVDRVAMAGSYFGDPNDLTNDAPLVTTDDNAILGYDASIVIDTVIADPADAARLVFGTKPAREQLVGIGVHPDVHALVFSNHGASLWTGCDGGIYRSDRPLRPAGFYPCNFGLSISETNYLAASPVHEGDLMVGLQDNGTAVRLSSGVWRVIIKGDGGGIARDPRDPSRWLAQYINANWRAETLARAGPLARGDERATAENDASAFYSMPASIAGHFGSAPNPVVPTTQTLIGTDRLWLRYTDAGGTQWVTLPTATDPLPAVIPAPAPPLVGLAPAPPVLDTTQDSLGESIFACRWVDADTAWVLTDNGVHRYDRAPGTHLAGGPGNWTHARILDKSAPPTPAAPTVPPPPSGKAKKAHPPPPPLPPPADPLDRLRAAATWTEIEPCRVSAAGITPVVTGLYLGTVGDPADTASDTLWWYDGVSAWWPTGLRTTGNNGQPLPAPVTALAADPDLPDEVWVGTTVGPFHGVRSVVVAPPVGSPPCEWTWTALLNGLPEAAVEDLSLFKDGTLRLLRAAIASRGVWELRLDQADVAALSYLRVHGADLRHRPTARLTQADGVTERPWHASPDIRPRLAPTNAALRVPGAAAWWRGVFGGNPERLRRFQSALRHQSNDPRVVGNGRWDGYFSEVLRDLGAPTVAQAAPAALAPAITSFNRIHVSNAFWNATFTAAHRLAEPWGNGFGTEADLLELTPPLPEGAPGEAACVLPARPWRVEVVVQHRGRLPRDGADVRVTLLWWADPARRHKARFNEPARWGALPGDWTPAVQAMLNSAGAVSAALPAGWHYGGATTATRRISLASQTLDPMNAGIARFDVNPGNLPHDRLVLLVAVVRAGADVVLANTTLRELALTHPAVAVRAVRIA